MKKVLILTMLAMSFYSMSFACEKGCKGNAANSIENTLAAKTCSKCNKKECACQKEDGFCDEDCAKKCDKKVCSNCAKNTDGNAVGEYNCIEAEEFK